MTDTTSAPATTRGSARSALFSETSTADGHRAKRVRSSYTTMAKVVVGKPGHAQETFLVYKDIIETHSTYFKAAFSKDWLAHQGHPATLPEHKPETFRMYLECVYTPGTVDFAALAGLQVVEKNVVNDDRGFTAMASLFELWILADYLGDVALANDVMDGIIFCTATYDGYTLSWSSLVFVYNATAHNAALRRWIVDWWAVTLSPEDCALELMNRMSPGLILLLLEKVLKYRKGLASSQPTIAQMSDYHM